MLRPEVRDLLYKALKGEFRSTITTQELLSREGLIKEYYQGVVERVREYPNRMLLKIGPFSVYLTNFSLPVFEGDVVKFRNFLHRSGKLYVDSEFMIVKRRKPQLRVREGIVYLVKGKIEKNQLKVNGRLYPINVDLSKYEGKEVVFQHVMFKNNSFIILPETRVFLVKK